MRLLALLLLQIRNFYGLYAVLVAGAGVFAVSADFFRVLGVVPAVGRTWSAEEFLNAAEDVLERELLCNALRTAEV